MNAKSIAITVAAITLWSQCHAQPTPCSDQWPAWSPDGRSVVFVSTDSGDHEIFTLSLDTGELAQMTNVPGRDAHPSFSPDGTRIAFQSPRGTGDTHLYLMTSSGADVRQLTRLPGFSGMPVWSPDGERLAFQWRPEKTGAKWQLMTANLADGSTTSITNGSANDQVVNWSPDGRRLVFHSDRTGRNQIYTWHDGVVTRLAETPYEDKSATWSPDGRDIAFVSTRDGVTGIYMMDADGSHQRRVGDLAIEHSLPFFSPDGERLLVTPSGPAGTEIWILDIESGDATEVPAKCTARNR